MLKVENLEAGYGKINVLKGISIEVPEGKIVSVIGANGAGKSTLLMTLSGIVPAVAGSIEFQGKSIEELPPHEIVRRGVVQVPEGRRVFAHLTVKENLDLGAFTRSDQAGLPREQSELMELFPILGVRRNELAGNLSGGEQQMLAMARALLAKPKLLMMDEPSLGLAPKMVETVFQIIQKINREGVTVLLVEQNAYKALSISHTAYVLETGAVACSGSGQSLLQNPTVRHAYLGE